MRTFPKFRSSLVAGAALALVAVAWAAPRKSETTLFRGRVVHFDAAAITVRTLKNPLLVRTFTYSPAVRKKVDKLLESGGYRYGDYVKIRYQPGTSVALAIYGKPSQAAHRARKRK